MRQVTMKTLVFLALLEVCIHFAAAVTHSLKYFYTASSGVPNFPEFVTVGLVDEVQISHYDSITMRAVTKQDWMSRVTADDPQYWERQTQGLNDTKELFKGNIEIAKLRFNQTGGFHIYQNMYGCEWDDETEEVRGYDQHGYDGEDFIVFDPETETWTAPTPQAFITKQKVEHDKALIAYDKNYLTKECVDWLKKYVDYRRSFLQRKELPSVSLLQKTPSSPVSCHATGFYFEAGGLLSTCDRAKMFWRKDGEELHEDVDKGDILPNNDGSFQMSVDLKPPTGDWEKYECVFQLAGVKNDIVTKLEKSKIRTNGGNPSDMTVIIVIVAVVVLALVAIAVIGYFIYKKNKAKRPPSPVSNPEVLEELNPKA